MCLRHQAERQCTSIEIPQLSIPPDLEKPDYMSCQGAEMAHASTSWSTPVPIYNTLPHSGRVDTAIITAPPYRQGETGRDICVANLNPSALLLQLRTWHLSRESGPSPKALALLPLHSPEAQPGPSTASPGNPVSALPQMTVLSDARRFPGACRQSTGFTERGFRARNSLGVLFALRGLISFPHHLTVNSIITI